jgi:hypothetical protein
MLCLNVPSPKESWQNIAARRVMWMGLAIIGPEFVLTYAAGQWSRARQSVKAFHAAGYKDWTMRLAFFADMGGFVLQVENCSQFPLNAKQLHWLVRHGHVDYPNITVAEIWDKSKQDQFAKIITCVQIGYLILQCVGRAAQHLAITTLELSALAIVVCSLMTSYFWLHKPFDVHTAIMISAHSEMKTIAGIRRWTQTPLDFVDENGPGWSMNVQPFMKMPVIPAERPIQRIPDDRFPMNPYGSQEYILCFGTLLFTAIHVAGWNFLFPSKIEEALWRIASLLLFGITAAFWLLETAASWKRLGRWTRLYSEVMKRRFRKNYNDEEEVVEEEEMRGRKQRTVLPLAWEFWSIFPLAILYGIARSYLLVEPLLELRNLDATAFVEVKWSEYFPHI